MNSRGLSHTWMGGNDIDEEGTWKWTDGSPFEFTYWNSGQPNNSGGDEDCMHAWGIERERGETWNDETCSDSLTYLCSKKKSSGRREKTKQTRTNWPRKVRELILDSDPWSQGVKGWAYSYQLSWLSQLSQLSQ